MRCNFRDALANVFDLDKPCSGTLHGTPGSVCILLLVLFLLFGPVTINLERDFSRSIKLKKQNNTETKQFETKITLHTESEPSKPPLTIIH